MKNEADIRYYRGKVRCALVYQKGRKAIIQYLEDGIIGPSWGRKQVKKDTFDITLIRHCWRKRK